MKLIERLWDLADTLEERFIKRKPNQKKTLKLLYICKNIFLAMSIIFLGLFVLTIISFSFIQNFVLILIALLLFLIAIITSKLEVVINSLIVKIQLD